MGRSFIIRPKQKSIIQIEELFRIMQNFPEFSLDLSQVQIRQNQDFVSFRIPEAESSFVFLSFGNHHYSVESRAVDYSAQSRKLFLAVTCAAAVLTDGTVNSADGAWYNPDKFYSGAELWNEFITLKENFRHQPLFVWKNQLKGTCYLEFQICENPNPVRNGKTCLDKIQNWKEDSLYLDIGNVEEYNKFYELYAIYFQNALFPNGQHGFDPYGINYYSPEETVNIRQALQAEHLPELLNFLEDISMMQKFNGFYILGI